MVRVAADSVGGVLGGSASVQRRLVRLGSASTVEEFRVRQVIWGLAGFTASTVVATFVWSARGGNVPALLFFCLMGFLAGVLACDNRLSAQVRTREERMRAEFPVVADLLALAVAAGESPVAGLERILSVIHGSLGHEIGRVLADVRTGTPVASAFDALAARTGVPSIARFAEGMAVAIERGTPLVDVLHAQAADVREATRRDLIEAGGRREVAMMIPVVFLILPVTVVFAFFPGYVGLHLAS
jgi:tight adherence protein C